MPELVSLDQVKEHLRITSDHEDDDLQRKLDQAHALVFDYVRQRIADEDAWQAQIDAWTESTAPAQVLAAIERQCADLYRRRGDDETDLQREPGGLSPDAKSCLYRFRDPALA
jgi:hypothetical protein